MQENLVIQRLIDTGIVAVIRAETADAAINIAKACLQGGITAIEVTFTVPDADQVILTLAKTFDEQTLLIGAGTVLDAQTARQAVKAGARFIVSPGFDSKTGKQCRKLDTPYLPGCLTITEIIRASQAGASIIKLFPGSAVGPGYVKAVRGPLPDIRLMPTGGVSLDNIEAWFQAGVVAVGIGGELTGKAASGDYAGVTEQARRFVEAVKKARGA